MGRTKKFHRINLSFIEQGDLAKIDLLKKYYYIDHNVDLVRLLITEKVTEIHNSILGLDKEVKNRIPERFDVYACPKCYFKTTRRWNLDRHIERRH